MDSSNTAFGFIEDALAKRKSDNLFRRRVVVNSNVQQIIEVDGKHFLNFASNDYLGLSQHHDVLQSYAEGLSLRGAGSGASAVVTGYNIEHKRLEDDICEHTGKQACMLFSSGFAANQALCQALFSRAFTSTDKTFAKGASNSVVQDHIIADKFMHASFIEAATQTSARFMRYRHNDYSHLAKLTKQTLSQINAPNTLVASEGVFSMDGDCVNMEQLVGSLYLESSARQHQALVMIDDAHAIGVLGNAGMGTCDSSNMYRDKVDVLMGTFGKAIGTSGAFIAGTQNMIDYLVNFARHYVYSTAIPAATARATLTSFNLMRHSGVRDALLNNIALFKKLCDANGVRLLPSDSAIQPVIIGCPVKALACAQRLQNLGIWVGCIRTPTVPKHSDRLRITLSAAHQNQDISALVDALTMVLEHEDS